MELLHHFFEKQSQKFPEKTCLIVNDVKTNFQTIEESANQLARWLIAEGIQPEDIIGVLIHKSTDLYITLLGILKAGAAYLPIDPECPINRINYILEDSKMSLLLTSQIFSGNNFPLKKIIEIEKIKPLLASQSKERPALPKLSSENLCYIIYTSGTTGAPKGVCITHSSICNYVESVLPIYEVNAEDKVYQGFSIAFDASVEEIWLAFAAGGTLVTSSSKKVLKSAALADFLNFHKVTVFSTVPTMLEMLDPPLPSLRTLILGGERCPEKLIHRWLGYNAKIFNTYGPSEATIISTYLKCDGNNKLTIGKPIPNCEIMILDDQLKKVAEGQPGEICIGGKGLAKSYLNNPELTKEKFITYANNLRLYRSGDVGRWTDDGNIEYLGRLDDQVKIRGYRIEIKEIENVVLKLPGVRDTVVLVQELVPGLQTIICYLVLEENISISLNLIKKLLAEQLPDYMMPSLFKIVPEFPKLSSGKIDKKSLSISNETITIKNDNYKPPTTKLEKKIAFIWESFLKLTPISLDSDFFKDLGGHSLTAAYVISEMRRHKEMSHASLIDLFENPTIQQLAKKINNSNKHTVEDSETYLGPEKFTDKIKYFINSTIQAIISLILVTMSPWHFFILAAIVITFSVNYINLTWPTILCCWLAVLFLLQPSLLLLSVGIKWLLLGKVKPGKHRVWSWYFLRWWIVDKFQNFVQTDHFVGTPFINFYYRLMGCRIGKNCYLGSNQFYAHDLLSIGDNSSICADVLIAGYKIEKGWLKIGEIKIGENCFIGANAVLSINTQLKNNAKLGEHSLLAEGQSIQENESFIGSPSYPGRIDIPVEFENKLSHNSFYSFLYGFIQYWLIMSLELILVFASIPSLILILYVCYVKESFINCLWAIPLAAFMYLFFLSLQIIVLKRLVGPIKPGDYQIKSLSYLKIWFVERLLGLSLSTLESVYGTIYSANWLRILGAKIGKNSELSTINFTLPDMLNIGHECFVGDSTMLAPFRIYQGCISLRPVYFGNRVFVGNGSVIPGETQLNDNSLIACSTCSPHTIPSNTSWIGSPAFSLPGRKLNSNFPNSKTYQPSLKASIMRGIFEFIKIIFPPLCFYFILTLDIITLIYLTNKFSILFAIAAFPFFSILYVLLVVYLLILTKWILIGSYRETTKPMWSTFVYRSELMTSLYDTVIVPFLLEPLFGTPFIAHFLRLLGAKIGRYTFINTPYFSEFDLVNIEDGVSLNHEATIQTHLYEDRIFQMSTIKIEKGCSIGNRSILLYDTIMQHDSSLGNLSLLMKGETLYPYSYWEGVPARRAYLVKRKS